MADLNPLYDANTDNAQIADEKQKMINTPLAGGQLSAEDRAFLDKLLELVENGTIQLYVPSSLINTSVYEELSTEAKGKADQNAVAMLAKIRDIVELEKAPMDTDYQVENLVHSLRLNKERMEGIDGDIFII